MRRSEVKLSSTTGDSAIEAARFEWGGPPLENPALPVVPVAFARGGRTYRFFSTVTTLGTPQDVTSQELRIECFFPVDGETEENVERLAEAEAREAAR